METILIIEDDVSILRGLKDNLEFEGYKVDVASDGQLGLKKILHNNYDLILLDVMLPNISGFDICKRVRKEGIETPIIFLTAKSEEIDKVLGLETGADDYLVKPFDIQELEARVRSIIRRHKGEVSKEILTIGDLAVDTATLSVTRAGQSLNTTPIGFKILTVLMRASPAVVSRRELERQVWGDILPDSDTLRSHLYNLRKVIDKPFDKQLLQTIQGSGYKIVSTDAGT